jgi:hypothetical protein
VDTIIIATTHGVVSLSPPACLEVIGHTYHRSHRVESRRVEIQVRVDVHVLRNAIPVSSRDNNRLSIQETENVFTRRRASKILHLMFEVNIWWRIYAPFRGRIESRPRIAVG